MCSSGQFLLFLRFRFFGSFILFFYSCLWFRFLLFCFFVFFVLCSLILFVSLFPFLLFCFLVFIIFIFSHLIDSSLIQLYCSHFTHICNLVLIIIILFHLLIIFVAFYFVFPFLLLLLAFIFSSRWRMDRVLPIWDRSDLETMWKWFITE